VHYCNFGSGRFVVDASHADQPIYGAAYTQGKTEHLVRYEAENRAICVATNPGNSGWLSSQAHTKIM